MQITFRICQNGDIRPHIGEDAGDARWSGMLGCFMYVKIAVLKESQLQERRIALVPAVVSKLVKLGAKLHMQSGAGEAAKFGDSAYTSVAFTEDRRNLVGNADVVIAVQPPAVDVISAMQEGAILISFVYADRDPALLQRLLEKKITCFAMERVPRIPRAQPVDALSSQAILAGYYAVQLGAVNLTRILPKLSTGAGAIGAAKVLVIGLGVAGLEAVATARRMGAVVECFDVRSETQEQALSLGASFIASGIDARGTGGYARELNAAEISKASDILTPHLQSADLIITSAAVPGRPAPRVISQAQRAGMRPGAVIVDLAADHGGNCEDTQPGETVKIGGVTILAPLNVPSLLGEDASDLYARNVYNLLTLMLRDNVIKFDWDDEVLASMVLTHDGEIKSAPDVQEVKPRSRAKDKTVQITLVA
jgi:H+-translocating NAD(P) transhydrogenase subunit alpha